MKLKRELPRGTVKVLTPKEQVKGFYDIERDGITQGLLANWMSCRFKALWFLKGWVLKNPSFPLTHGSITHGILELAYEDIRLKRLRVHPDRKQTLGYIQKIERQWHKENPHADKKTLEFVELSLMVAEATMPTYFEWWHKDIKTISWEKIEGNFVTPFTLPDGRKTILRGAMDGVYRNPRRWLFETKTKGRISAYDLVDYLPFELQVNFYVMNLVLQGGEAPRGVLYNIIRRSQLKQGKKEGVKQFAKRVAADIIDFPEKYFIRMEVSISREEQAVFMREITGTIKDFYDWFEGKVPHYRNTGQCETKYGRCEYLTAETGSMAPYEKRKSVFRELEDI